MNTRNTNIFVVLCAITLLSACSNEPSIKSASMDKVTIGAPANKFLEAYDLAKKECQKNTRKAIYITDETADLKEVSFECIGEEEKVVADAETNTEMAEDSAMDTQMEAEPAEDAPQ